VKEKIHAGSVFISLHSTSSWRFNAIDYVKKVFKTEINSVTDNPNIFIESDQIISGNFHGQPLALALDFIAIALAELGSISERRTYQLISGLRNLPAFLVDNPGLNSGLMIPQYTAASIASQNKQLATPSSKIVLFPVMDKKIMSVWVRMGPQKRCELWII
jgi:histidine ammonia-lyase